MASSLKEPAVPWPSAQPECIHLDGAGGGGTLRSRLKNVYVKINKSATLAGYSKPLLSRRAYGAARGHEQPEGEQKEG